MRNQCIICGVRVQTGNPRQRTCGAACAERFKAVRQERIRGRTRVRSDGYVEEHTGRKYVLQHRLVVEMATGHQLRPHDHVHHRNGDRADNRIENLEVVAAREHLRMHPDWPQIQRRRITHVCERCGKEYERKASRSGETRFCSKSCMSSAVATARWERWREERSGS